jgi:peptidoglycan/LPS O-acetylase OafA/YrhL
MVVQRWSDNRLIIGVVALSLSLAIAYAMHILVEEPCARLRRKFGSRSAEIINRTGEVEVVPTGD